MNEVPDDAQEINKHEGPAPQKTAASNQVSSNNPGSERAVDPEPKATSNVSLRRIESNRQNSQRSTGPRTAAGKKRVSRNAVKHGFYSKWLLIRHPDGKECQSEFNDFYADVRGHYQPVGFLEDLWVEKIAVWCWRLRRLIRCESGQITKALAGHSYELQQSKEGDLSEQGLAPPNSSEMDALTDHLILPDKDDLDKLLRYEAMMNRQLNHAIAELERLQTRRRGEPTM